MKVTDVHARPVVASLQQQHHPSRHPQNNSQHPQHHHHRSRQHRSHHSQQHVRHPPQKQIQQQPQKNATASMQASHATHVAHRSSSHPFTSICISPVDGTYGIASGRDVLHVLRLNVGSSGDDSFSAGGSASRLEEIRSFRISQHFQAPPPSPQPPPSDKVGSNLNSTYPHVRDALRLVPASVSSATPSGMGVGGPSSGTSPLPGALPGTITGAIPTPISGGGGGANVTVTDVAWSLPQSYYVVEGGGGVGSNINASGNVSGTSGNSGVMGSGPAISGGSLYLSASGHGGAEGNELGSSSRASVGDAYDGHVNTLHSKDAFDFDQSHQQQYQQHQHPVHYPPFVNRSYIGAQQQRIPPSCFSSSSSSRYKLNSQMMIPLEDTSVVAAAGSNGVIVAWHARSALIGVGDISSPSSSSNRPTSSTIPNSANTQSRKNNSGGWGLAGFGLGGFNIGGLAGASGLGVKGGFGDSAADNVNAPQVTSAASIGQPEAVFLAHSRAVNRLAWHPTGNRPYLLLSASQDGTVKLWDRRATTSSCGSPPGAAGAGSGGVSASNISQPMFQLSSKPHHHQPLISWFGFGNTSGINGGGGRSGSSSSSLPGSLQLSPTMIRTAKWHCVSTYQPKCFAVRDIKWNPFIDDVFGMVTDNGMLCVYDIRLNKPMIQSPAHAGEATTIDWHPKRKYVIATGGGRDRSVKVWDLETTLNVYKQDESNTVENIRQNSSSLRSDNSESLATASLTSSEGVMASPINAKGGDDTDSDLSRGNYNANQNYIGSQPIISSGSPMKRNSSGFGYAHSRHHSKQNLPLYVLSISAPVTRIRWRPSEDRDNSDSNNNLSNTSASLTTREPDHDHNDSMIAVATSSISGANAGGNGSVGLWSYHRPFMPISVVEGHRDGAVTDFAWVDRTFVQKWGYRSNNVIAVSNRRLESSSSRHCRDYGEQGFGVVSSVGATNSLPETPSSRYDKPTYPKEHTNEIFTDSNSKINYEGGCASTEKPQALKDKLLKEDHFKIMRDWQTILTVGRDGRCLLQHFSLGERPILQVPSATFALANLSPFQPGFGSLQIMAVHQSVNSPGVMRDTEHPMNTCQKTIPKSELVFSITDQGDWKDLSSSSLPHTVDVAPEVTHLSRFAELYITTISPQLSTKAAICRHNATVAESLNRGAITQMWNALAIILEGAGLDDIPSSSHIPRNAMAYLLIPTLRKLLLQRANAGDVQTCVALCEVMNVIVPPTTSTSVAKSKLPNLTIELIREWYLSYIDLLQQMCLFTQAACLIRNCRDPLIGALNQQSTTIHESCPMCGKPLLGSTSIEDNSGTKRKLAAQRVCRNCRGRIGLCFLCHQPVNGIFVWCPGCGHGGHLDHALEWFGTNEVCPTGCGHKCNLFSSSINNQRLDSSRRNYS